MGQSRALLILRETIALAGKQVNSYPHSQAHCISHCLPLRKAITKKYPRPDVDCVYTPTLDNYLPSLLPTVKAVDKDNKFLQDRVLDTVDPVAMLFEHVYGFLSETKPGENVILSYEQMKDLGAITSNAIRLLGNASALLSKERRVSLS